MKTLTDSQVRVFLSAARGLRHEALFWMAVFTGLREGELFGLKWSDLDWQTKHLRVQRQLQQLQGKAWYLQHLRRLLGSACLYSALLQ